MLEAEEEGMEGGEMVVGGRRAPQGPRPGSRLAQVRCGVCGGGVEVVWRGV